MLLREPELIASVKLPAEACSVDLFGRVLTQLRQRMQAGRPTALSALEADFTPEEMAHLSYIMSRDTAPVSDEAFADYLRVIQEEYEGRSLTRSETACVCSLSRRDQQNSMEGKLWEKNWNFCRRWISRQKTGKNSKR